MPPCASRRVLVAAPGALITRLLIVIVLGALPAVVVSLFTVLVPALVIRTMERPLNGGTFSDQFEGVSHFPLALLVQLFVRPPAITWRAWQNSVFPLPVAVMNTPGKMGEGQLTVKLPPASVVMFVEIRRVLPSPYPDGSAAGLENNSRRNAAFGAFEPLITVAIGVLLASVITGKPGVTTKRAFTSMPRP